MRRAFFGMAVLVGWLALVSTSQAQVFVRAPFVRVQVGGGVAVRAPFVNLYVPPAGPVVYSPTGPPTIILPPPTPVPVPVPAPPVKDDTAPPQPIQPVAAQTIEAFTKNFQPKAGSYEVSILNPTTGKPSNVRFTLPEGAPRRVIVGRNHLEFVYGLRQFVRIEFDRDGATVISR